MATKETIISKAIEIGIATAVCLISFYFVTKNELSNHSSQIKEITLEVNSIKLQTQSNKIEFINTMAEIKILINDVKTVRDMQGKYSQDLDKALVRIDELYKKMSK